MTRAGPDPVEPRWHVVLIGIDAYHGGAPPLGGCVNDIDAIQHVLLDRLGVPPARIRRYAATLNDGVVRPRAVATRLPTRANLRAGLDEIARDVRPGDRVFVYYSGHGTRRVVRTAAGQRYFREALVPHDHIVFDPTTQDEREQLIFDWELNQWIARVAHVTTSITVILDCCCAAGTTRAIAPRRTRARFAPPARTADFALAAEVAPPAVTRGLAFAAGSVAGCMVVAACLDDEVARESEAADSGGPAHGELTRALLAQLTPDRPLDQLAWSAIWRDVVARVKTRSPDQTPWLSSHLGRRVFCGPPTDGDLGYAVQRVGDSYRLDAGTLSGVTPGAVIALYPPLARQRHFPPLGDPVDLALRTGLLRVTAARLASAIAEPVAGEAPGQPLEPGARGRLIAPAAGARLRVALAPYEAALAARIAASKLFEVVPEGEPRELELVRCASGDRELTDGVFGPNPAGASYLLHRIPAAALAAPPPAADRDPVHAPLEHYLTYAAPIRMAKACSDLPRALRIRLLDCNAVASPIAASEAEDVALAELQPDRAPDYLLRPGTAAGRGDHFTVELENVSATDLFVTVFLCQNSGRVMIYASRVLVTRASRTRLWYQAAKGVTVSQSLPPGRTRALDRIVAIGTTDRAATLDHLQSDRTFDATRDATRSAARDVRASAPPPPPEVWTSAVAVLRSAP